MREIEKTYYRWVSADRVDWDAEKHAAVTCDNGKKLIYCKITQYSGSGLNPETGDFTEKKGGRSIKPMPFTQL